MSLRIVLKAAGDRLGAVLDRTIAGVPAIVGVAVARIEEIKGVLQIIALLVGIASTCLLTYWKRPREGEPGDEE